VTESTSKPLSQALSRNDTPCGRIDIVHERVLLGGSCRDLLSGLYKEPLSSAYAGMREFRNAKV